MEAHSPTEKAIASVTEKAKARGMDLHESFCRELENYSLHAGVRDLSDDQLEFVIETIGEGALLERESRASKTAGAGDVRNVLVEWCADPFSDCSNAAMRILDAHAESPAQAAKFLSHVQTRNQAELGY